MTKIIFLSFLLVGLLMAADIKGVVRHSLNGAPVIGANVMLENNGTGAATDFQGRFFISNVPPGMYQIKVDYVGYMLAEPVLVDVGSDDVTDIELKMREEILESESIVVTGTRTKRLIKDSPVSTEIIHADEIKNIGAENIGEVLEERAGIIVNQDGVRGGLLSAQLQGLDDNHTLILIDGAPVIGRIAGALDLSRVSVQNVERIEIVKGAASALYGSEAVGGVINIITREAQDNFKYGFNANMGSFNSLNLKADLSTVQNKTAVTLSAENHRADGYDLDPLTQNTTADDFNNYNLFGKLKRQMGDMLTLQASGQFFDQRQEGFDGGERITDIQNWYANIGAEWQLKNFSKINARFYHTTYYKHIDRAGTIVDNTERLSRGEFIYNRLLANHILTVGGEATDNRLETNRIAEGNKTINNYSLYIQDEIFYQTLEFNLGARADYHSEFDFYLSPKIGMLYKPTNQLRFRASFARGFRAPDFIELYLILDHTGLTSQPYIAFGNPDLTPETSTSFNLGSEYHFNDNTIFRLNFFNNYLKDMINSLFLRTTAEGVQIYTYENLSEAYTRGFELDFTLKFLRYLRLTSGYAYLKTKDVTRAQPLFNRPEHSGRVKLDWDLDQIGFSGNVRWRYIGERLHVNVQGQTVDAPWYAVWSTRLEQHVYKPLSVYLGVDNIFDYQNRDYVALPGRIVYVGIEIN